MTADELAGRMNNVVRDLQDNLGRLMVQAGSNTLANVRTRIVETGKDAEGGSFAPYSTKPMLTGCKSFVQKEACQTLVGTKEKRKDLKWVTISRGGKNVKLFTLPGGYKEFRRIQGRRVDFVNFSLEGRMWANTKIVSDEAEHQTGVVRIAPESEENKKKLEGNTERRGPILKMSQGEIKEVKDMFNDEIMVLFKKNGL